MINVFFSCLNVLSVLSDPKWTLFGRRYSLVTVIHYQFLLNMYVIRIGYSAVFKVPNSCDSLRS